ncbi:hybrid sensor histidine kinase/response regulator [Pseudodesulfovibrio piezophilus]|uniref:histidine kinase n=1 Tax=Pseudodesulfovibrio piezophilus (strain DSM 21447 / JCM 15486 / C1TLV30) TaxID=1322246 RepID=M1WK13_PSEP2|nr:response regulator [Pseudodesulfovibrio piezophilus]CCH48801.1 Multi-sensor signal transduction histidine kinase [Pseudodesulfovibrio piezophilus C1TLV30]
MTEAPLYAASHPFSVLLVDDEEDIRELLGMLLNDLGYTVQTAKNGQAALELFRTVQTTERPDIILTDIKMPGMDGIELLRTIKAEAPEIEVIMISGHGDMQLAIESLKFQAADFITKPIDDDILAIALNKVTEKLSLRRQIKEHTENLERLVEEKSARVVELERQTAAEQIVDGLSSAMSIISDDVDDSGVFNELPCFISIHSSDLKVITANGLYEQRFGDRTGESSRSIYTSHTGQGSCPAYEAVATRLGGRSTATLMGLDGAEIPAVVYTAPITGNDGKVSLVLEVAVDVSEVNRLQTALTATQHKYERLFDQVPCYITVQDQNMRIVEANARFREDFGFDRGPNCHHAYKNLNDVCDGCPVQKTFSDGLPHQRETVVTSKNGTQIDILVWTAPLRNEHGEIEHVLEVSTNISKVRALQNQLTSLGMMLGSMSHGVKGLLTAIDGGIYRVESGLSKNDMDRVDKGWKVVKHRIGHMKKMVMDILYYAKSRELELSRTTLGDYATDLADLIAPKAADHDISFVRRFSQPTVTFEADVAALSSALVNFLENAMDACVFDRSTTRHCVTFTVSADSKTVHFEITDNGIGMDRETRENMFTLFFSSKGANGTGIGLFISNQVIARHNGTIDVDSSVGKGTHFHIRIPMTQAGCENCMESVTG